jgi:hypothetical protein
MKTGSGRLEFRESYLSEYVLRPFPIGGVQSMDDTWSARSKVVDRVRLEANWGVFRDHWPDLH